MCRLTLRHGLYLPRDPVNQNNKFEKMPKLRRASVAHNARQAKIRKRRQRENLFKREQERVRDAQRYLHSRFRSHPEADFKEHATEKETHRSERLDMHDMERLRQRNELNVSSRRQPLDIDNRREEQVFIIIESSHELIINVAWQTFLVKA